MCITYPRAAHLGPTLTPAPPSPAARGQPRPGTAGPFPLPPSTPFPARPWNDPEVPPAPASVPATTKTWRRIPGWSPCCGTGTAAGAPAPGSLRWLRLQGAREPKIHSPPRPLQQGSLGPEVGTGQFPEGSRAERPGNRGVASRYQPSLLA